MPGDDAVRVAVDVRCQLGEGPIWHPERRTLLWFDIYGQVLHEAAADCGAVRALGFGEPVSAAALVDGPHVVVAGASGLYRVNLETGLPLGAPELFLDLSGAGLRPDGSVVDAEGCLWNAQFGAGRLARYRPDGRLDRVVALPVSMPTCPAFGGPDLKTMFVTSAWADLDADQRRREPLAGAVFAFELDTPGLPERRMAPRGPA